MLDLASYSLDLNDEESTVRLGEDLALTLRAGDLVALHGDLGMGKTTLARAVIRAIADDDTLDVPSPTFTLVQSYPLRIPVHHVDLYRLEKSNELEELGLLSETLEKAIVLLEWPERAPEYFGGAIHIVLTENGEGRHVEIRAPKEPINRIVRTFAIRAFLNRSGYTKATRRFFPSDASARFYESIYIDKSKRLILMDSPVRQDEPVVHENRSYSQITGLAQSVNAFIGVTNILRLKGFSAPEILAMDLSAGLLLVSYLGGESFLMQDGSVNIQRYIEAGKLLATLHENHWPEKFPVTPGIEHRVPNYDYTAFAVESELLLDWYFPFVKGREASTGEREEFTRQWVGLIDRLSGSEKSLVLRDYHSPNIIWREEQQGLSRLGLLDVQDAVFGPTAYDVSSLALDARVMIPFDLEKSIVEAYCAARVTPFDRVAFEEAYAITAAQRNTRLLGLFVRLAQQDGKTGYLKHLSRIRGYLTRVLAHPVLADLRVYYEMQGFLTEQDE